MPVIARSPVARMSEATSGAGVSKIPDIAALIRATLAVRYQGT